VRTGRAHAALVFDADGLAQGGAQYGTSEELPGLAHQRPGTILDLIDHIAGGSCRLQLDISTARERPDPSQ
jgi:hypothetical protein